MRDHYPPFSTCWPAHPTRRPTLDMIRLIGSFLAVSNVPQPGGCISGRTLLFPATNPVDTPPRAFPPSLPSRTVTRTAHSAFIFPHWNERQTTPPCLSAVSIPFAFYPSLSQSHCESLPLQPFRHSLTFLRQLSPSCVLVQLFAPFQPCTTTFQPSLALISLVLSTGCPDILPPIHFGTSATVKGDPQVSHFIVLVLLFQNPCCPHLSRVAETPPI